MNFYKFGGFLQRMSVYAVLTGLLLGLSGCFETKEDTTMPQSTGTIQGKLIDSVTQQAVVGAIVDMGGSTATTNIDGQFEIGNIKIPFDASGNINTSIYKVTIDMRSVTAPLNMAGAVAPQRYPDFLYDIVTLSFATANSTSNASPINYLIQNVDFKVGKLAATMAGVVADKNTLQTVAAGYTVKLYSLGASGGSGNETIVGSALTDANGAFTFANIESLRDFRIDAWNADQTYRGSQNVTAPVDGGIKNLSVQTNDAVLVASTDTLAPTIISVTPQMDADIAPAATDVVFTFSEPILQTVDTGTSPSVTNGLYNRIEVKYMGSKVSNSATASNIAHTLAWNSTFTQLTVSISSLAASSKYSVDMTPANALLVDLNGNGLNNTIDRRVLNFTTNGSVTPVAPSLVTVVNSSSLNYNSPAVLLDWLPVSGAKAYNVYRAQNFTSAAGQLQHVGSSPSTLTSDFSDTLPVEAFVFGQSKLTYSYVVTSVSADNVESAASPVVTAQDLVIPTATIPAGLAASYTISFSEPVDEASAITLSNYVFTQGVAASVPIVNSAVLNAGLTTVTLTLSASTATGNILDIAGISDIAGNAMTSANRTF